MSSPTLDPALDPNEIQVDIQTKDEQENPNDDHSYSSAVSLVQISSSSNPISNKHFCVLLRCKSSVWISFSFDKTNIFSLSTSLWSTK